MNLAVNQSNKDVIVLMEIISELEKKNAILEEKNTYLRYLYSTHMKPRFDNYKPTGKIMT